LIRGLPYFAPLKEQADPGSVAGMTSCLSPSLRLCPARWREGSSSAPLAFERQPEGRRIGRRQRSAKREKTHMPLYEHVFLARQDLAQAQVDALAENATKILTDNGGKVVKTETWGLKSLAYKIAKNRKAHYVMLDVDAPAPAIAELERQTNLNEDVIRFMTIRVDEHENGPSAMMRRDRSGRGDRGDRGDRPNFRAREEEVE
jgi:small subunit ribosomal protein S6